MIFWGNTLDLKTLLCFVAVLGLARLPGHLLEKLRERNRLQLFPELNWVSEEERNAIWEKAQGGEWWTGTALVDVFGFLLVVLLLVPGDLLLVRMGVVSPWARHIAVVMGMCTLFGGCPILNDWWQRKLLHRRFRREVNELGIPLCLSCGYRLQGVPGEVCPECGSAHPHGICFICEGSGIRSRRHWLWIGIGLLAGWVIVMGLCLRWALSFPPPRPKRAWALFAFAFQFMIPGLVVLAAYFGNGAKAPCTRCKGTGKKAVQGEQARGEIIQGPEPSGS